MNEHSQMTTIDGAEPGAPAIEEAVPPPRPSPMPTQAIEFWTPRLLFLALLYWLGRTVRRLVFSPADSHEPQ